MSKAVSSVRIALTFVLAVSYLAVLLSSPHAEPYKPATGTYAIKILLGEWIDPARENRVVPFKIYFAPSVQGARSVVVFSHGLGGSREANAVLGERLASLGYVAVHIQHRGSDEGLWAGMTDRAEILKVLGTSIKNPAPAIARFRDVPFALLALDSMNASEGPLKGRLDMTRVGMSGHSYGAVSTLVAAGQRVGPQSQFSFKEPRFRAGIAYSPNLPNTSNLDLAYKEIAIPIFHMTGTRDANPFDPSADPAVRTKPYELITGAKQYLLVLNEADHATFGVRDRPQGPAAQDARHHSLILEASIAFWDAHLLDDPAALNWLRNGGFASILEKSDRFSWKN